MAAILCTYSCISRMQKKVHIKFMVFIHLSSASKDSELRLLINIFHSETEILLSALALHPALSKLLRLISNFTVKPQSFNS